MSHTTIPELIERRAQEQPDDTAYTFWDYESDPAGVAESITWSELRDRVEVVAEQLAKLGAPGSGPWCSRRRAWTTSSASSGRSAPDSSPSRSRCPNPVSTTSGWPAR